ncbi:MAG: O-antigen ligase family protein [Bacteroidales bacterium]|nr:O-antigen ligase family protein [Bacteroidales bacterium]
MNPFQIKLLVLSLFCLVSMAMLLNFSLIYKTLGNNLKNMKAGHLVWFILFLAILRIRDKTSGNLIVDNYFQLILVFFATSILVFALMRSISSLPRLNASIIFIALYAFSGIFSGFYSPMPFLSTYKALIILLCVLECLLILTYKPRYYSLEYFINLTYFFYLFLLFSFVVGLFIFPEKSIHYVNNVSLGLLQGVLIKTNPNTVGVISGILTLLFINRFFVTTKFKEKILYITFILFSLTILILAQSRTCIAAFVCSLIIVLIFNKKIVSLLILFFLGFSIFAIQNLSIYKNDLINYYKRGQSEQAFESWSGRKIAWMSTWKRFEKSPVLGYGMAAGVEYGAVSKSLIGSHMHSSYFEILLNTGLLGFIPWFLCLVVVSKNILKRLLIPPDWFDKKMKAFHIEVSSLLIFFLIRSIAGTTFAYFDFTFIFYACFILYSVVIMQNAEEALQL